MELPFASPPGLGTVADADADDPSVGLRVRPVWISDLHLGTPGCQAEALLGFLKQVECETLTA